LTFWYFRYFCSPKYIPETQKIYRYAKENISAIQQEAQKQAWIQGANEFCQRQEGAFFTKKKRTEKNQRFR
jgi:hypothetical protein